MPEQRFTGIGHMAITARDLDAQAAFYTEKVGLTEMFRLNRDDGSLMLVYLRITDTQFLEIFPNGQGDTPARNTTGYNHLCLTVSDLNATVAALAANGVPIDVAPKTGKDHNQQAWISDSEGNRIELMQMSSDSLQAQAIARLSR